MEDMETPTEVIKQGGALQKSQSEFTQAIVIQKPRERNQIIQACEEEAAIAGEEFFYSWTINTNKGPKLVEGLSIGGAVAAARNWGNCALPCKVEEEADHYIFTASFVDFETGFNLQRVFKQRKEQGIGMKKDPARAEDIVFQIGQSKALRNVILNAMPSWLTKKMLDKAKEEVIGQITKIGIPVAQKKALEFFEQRGIDIERVEKKMSKNHSHWTAEDLAIIKGAMSSLVNGQESADSLFPAVGEEAAVKTDQKTTSLKEKIAAKKNPVGRPPLKKTKPAVPIPQPPEIEINKSSYEDLDSQKTYKFEQEIQKLKEGGSLTDKGLQAELESFGYETFDKLLRKPEDHDTILDYLKDTYPPTKANVNAGNLD